MEFPWARVVILLLLLLAGGCSHLGRHRRARTGEAPAPPTLIAHRGLHVDWPENSLAALMAAWNAGVRWCECDVYLSADGQVVLLHDKTLDRTTDATGPVAERTGDQLRKVHLRKQDGTVTPCPLPSLEQVLAVMPAGCSLLIEIKPPDHEPLVREVLRLAAGRNCCVQSFSEANIQHAQRINPNIPVAFLVDKPEALKAAMESNWPDLNISRKLLDPGTMEACRRRGKSLGVWTVNEPAEIQRILALRPDRIITDDPLRIRQMLE